MANMVTTSWVFDNFHHWVNERPPVSLICVTCGADVTSVNYRYFGIDDDRNSVNNHPCGCDIR